MIRTLILGALLLTAVGATMISSAYFSPGIACQSSSHCG